MAKVKVIKRYFDLEAKTHREIGEAFEENEPRLSCLESWGFVYKLPDEEKTLVKSTTKTTRKPKKTTPEA